MAVKLEGPFNLDWDVQDKSGLGGLSDEKKERLNDHVIRLNADFKWLQKMKVTKNQYVPKIYNDQAKELVDRWYNTARIGSVEKKNTEVMIAEENFVLDREKARVYYEQSIGAQIFQSVTRPLGKFRWDIKQYAIKKVENSVKFGRKFDQPRLIELELSDQSDHGIGWYVGYQINRFDLLENEGSLFDLQYETVLEAATQMARAGNRHLFTGTTSALSTPADDGEAGSGLGYTGFCNNSNNQAFTIATPSTYGNILKGLKNGLAELRKVYATQNCMLLWSAGLPDQAEQNYPTYGHGNYNEWDEIQRVLVGGNKPIKQVWTSDLLTGATLSNTTQTAILLKLDPRLMSRLIVLGLQTLPSLEKQYSDDISEVMLTADILRFNVRADTTLNPFNVAQETDLTTASEGYRSEERMA